jgi:hypothetical protein
MFVQPKPRSAGFHFTQPAFGLARPLAIVLAVALCALPASAQFIERASRPQVTVAPIGTIDVQRGHSAPLTIALRVNRGFHINSHRPRQDYLLPTVVHLNPPDGIMIVNIAYPEAQDVTLPFAGKDKMSVYSGSFEVTAEVRAARTAAYGRLRVHGHVRYQACDRRQCFPPKTVPLQFDVRVVRPRTHHRHRTAASPHIR